MQLQKIYKNKFFKNLSFFENCFKEKQGHTRCGKSISAITLHAHVLTIHRDVVIVHGWEYQRVTVIPV